MKRIFHRSWHTICRTAGIGAMCLLGLTTLSTSLQAKDSLNLHASEVLSFQLTNARNDASFHAETLAPIAVQQFAHQQAMSLGSFEPSNQGWNEAELEFFPLGPGTHSWLVNAHIEGESIGYMIITANRSGLLQLSEYGQGEENPYNLSLLQQSLKRHDLNLEKLLRGEEIHLQYASPMLAYWKVEQSGAAAIYIDATNGDTLPNGIVKALERDFWDEQTRSTTNPLSVELRYAIAEPSHVPSLSADPIHLQPAFDPAENLLWITSKALPATSLQPLIKQWKKHQEIVYSADDRNVLYGGPLPVSGYQIWRNNNGSEQMEYVAIGGHSSIRRFVPLDTLMEDGHFYTLRP